MRWPRLDEVWVVVSAILLATVLFAIACLLAGCGGRTACPKCPIAPPVEVVQVRVDCLRAPPPLKPGPLIDACEGWAGCLTREHLEKLFVYLAAIDQYSQEAWIWCGPLPVNQKED